MLIIDRILQYKVYRKIITSYVLLVIFTVTFVCAILFSLFSGSTAREISANAISMLQQTSYTADAVYNQVQNITSQLTIDNSVISFFYSQEDDKIKQYNVSLLLSKILNVYPFIKYIEICNLSNGNYYNTLDASSEQMEIYKQNTISILNGSKKKYMDFLPRKQEIYYKGSGTKPLSTLSYISFPYYLTSADYAIVINVDERYLQNTILSINSSSPDFSTFVMDSKGVILSHTDASFFKTSFADKAYVEKILEDKNNQGSFIQYIDGVKQLIVYAKSKNMDWYFVSLNPYSRLLGNLYQLRNATLFVALLLVILGLVISFLLTSNIYNPIKSILEKIKPDSFTSNVPHKKYDEYKQLSEAFTNSQMNSRLLRSSIYKSSRIIKEKYLLNLLKGNLSSMAVPEDMLEGIQEQLKGPCFRALVFKIDGYQSFRRCNSKEDQNLLRFAAVNIAGELLSKLGHDDALITEEDEIAVICQSGEAGFQEGILLTLIEIQEAVKDHYHFTISIGIGGNVDTIEDISLSYKAAKEYVKYRLFYGYECIIDEKKCARHNTGIAKYPAAMEKKLIEALQSGNSLQIKKAYEEFIRTLSEVSYYQAVNFSSQLMMAIFKHFDGKVDLQDENYRDYSEVMDQISIFETLEDMYKKIEEFSLKIVLLLDEKNNRLNTQKHLKTIKEVKQYVMEHYKNPALSLEMVSDVVELSPGYLGKLFKSMTDMSFTDFLTSVRLEKSQALLTETNETISSICEKVGIFNVPYFSTQFKRWYGMTPSQFREG